MSPLLRQALLIAGLSLLLALLVVALSRRRLLSLRYTLGWLALALIGMAAALFTGLMTGFARLLGITPTALFALGGVAILLLISIQLSISVSGLQAQVRRLAEANALLRDAARRMD